MGSYVGDSARVSRFSVERSPGVPFVGFFKAPCVQVSSVTNLWVVCFYLNFDNCEFCHQHLGCVHLILSVTNSVLCAPVCLRVSSCVPCASICVPSCVWTAPECVSTRVPIVGFHACVRVVLCVNMDFDPDSVVKLTGDNWLLWKALTIIDLKIEGIWDYVSGATNWKNPNAPILSLESIRLHCSDEILADLEGEDFASGKDLWNYLVSRYQKPKKAKMATDHRQCDDRQTRQVQAMECETQPSMIAAAISPSLPDDSKQPMLQCSNCGGVGHVTAQCTSPILECPEVPVLSMPEEVNSDTILDVPKLCKEGYEVMFVRNKAYVKKNDVTVMVAKRKNGLFYINSGRATQSKEARTCSYVSCAVVNPEVTNSDDVPLSENQSSSNQLNIEQFESHHVDVIEIKKDSDDPPEMCPCELLPDDQLEPERSVQLNLNEIPSSQIRGENRSKVELCESEEASSMKPIQKEPSCPQIRGENLLSEDELCESEDVSIGSCLLVCYLPNLAELPHPIKKENQEKPESLGQFFRGEKSEYLEDDRDLEGTAVEYHLPVRFSANASASHYSNLNSEIPELDPFSGNQFPIDECCDQPSLESECLQFLSAKWCLLMDSPTNSDFADKQMIVYVPDAFKRPSAEMAPDRKLVPGGSVVNHVPNYEYLYDPP